MGSGLIEPTKKKLAKHRLSDTERIFCAEYVANGLRAAAACKVAYPAQKYPSVYATTLMKRPQIKDYLGRLLHNRLQEAGLTADRILRQLELALFMDPLEVFEKGDVPGTYKVKSLDDIPTDVRQCISELKCKTETTEWGTDVHVEVKLMSKDKALELAMKYRGLLKDSGVVVNNTNNISVNFDSLADSGDVDAIEARLVSEERVVEQSDPVLLTHEEPKDG